MHDGRAFAPKILGLMWESPAVEGQGPPLLSCQCRDRISVGQKPAVGLLAPAGPGGGPIHDLQSQTYRKNLKEIFVIKQK